MVRESKVRANAKYDKEHCKGVYLKMNIKTDSDILDKLSSVPNVQGYIKHLIRKDIGSVPKAESEENTMKTYHIKPEYLDLWEGGDTPSNPDRIITENDVCTLSEEWEKPVEELLDQLVEI